MSTRKDYLLSENLLRDCELKYLKESHHPFTELAGNLTCLKFTELAGNLKRVKLTVLAGHKILRISKNVVV